MRKFLSTVVLAVVLAGVASSAANATTGPAMLTSRIPTGTGASLGGSTFQINPGGPILSCPGGDIKITSLTTTTARFDANYGAGCTGSISGITFALVTDVGCPWTLTFQNATFNDSTGAGANGTVDLPCPTVITVQGFGCTITVEPGNYGHIDTQNINASGGNDTSASPTGVRLTPTLNNLAITSNCPGIPSPGTATYRGQTSIHNVWGML